MRTVGAMALLACLVPITALCDCPPPPEAGSKALSDRPYAEDPPVIREPCPETPIEAIEPSPRSQRLRRVGIGGMGAGASIAGVGGLFWLGGQTTQIEEARRVNNSIALALAIAGGVLFFAGATVALFDAVIAPAPAPGGGAQLTIHGRF